MCKETCIADVIRSQQEAQRFLVHSSRTVNKTTIPPPPPPPKIPRGSALGIFAWRCVARTLEPLVCSKASLAEFFFALLDQTLKILPYPYRVPLFQKISRLMILLLLTRFWVNSNLLILFFESPFKFPLSGLTLTK